MTEEIMINGVNVVGCEFCNPSPLYKKEYSCHCRGYIQDDGLHTHLSCEHNPCCYYKQLKRLEQENKELKEKKDKYYQQMLDDEILMNELSLEVDLRKKESDFYLEKLSKYRSALEEIRENAQHCIRQDVCALCDYSKECAVPDTDG